ncbi:uncharacterized protein LOC112085365 [Eutrema salsugineum]|uniref:uncharacterized protein LOC112085365 n=1 Tax=Eutrema salsugineum TaxID=72664 RepID=UPI000CED46B9|nr:uncharacterized protein LOC112085365 [Eutrema salsugineum]
MNPEESKELERQVRDLMGKGYIRESLSPCAVPVLLVPKKDGTWRMCVDCRAVNNITIKYIHPILRLDDMLDELMVQPSSQSKCLSDHLMHLELVLKTLRGEELYANLKKCSFCTNKLVFLGFVVSEQRLQVDQEKIKAILDWPTPSTVSQFWSFHGLPSFYRRFVRDFSTVAALLTAVIKKNTPFSWGAAQETAFNNFKTRLTQEPVLALPDFDIMFEVECDASRLGIGVVLHQR